MLINGLVTLRVFNKLDYFRVDFMKNVEKAANATFCFLIVNRWLSIRFDMACLLFSISTAIICMAMRGKQEPGLLAYCILIMTDIIVQLSIALRMYCELQ